MIIVREGDLKIYPKITGYEAVLEHSYFYKKGYPLGAKLFNSKEWPIGEARSMLYSAIVKIIKEKYPYVCIYDYSAIPISSEDIICQMHMIRFNIKKYNKKLEGLSEVDWQDFYKLFKTSEGKEPILIYV